MNTPRRTELPPARQAALQSLRLILDQGYELQAGLDTVLSSRPLIPRDKALATELCYGYLRQKGRIEFLLSRFLKAPQKVSPPVFRILGVASYELLFSDRIPAYASLSWAVDLVKSRHGKGLSRMSNAVLRRLADIGAEHNDPALYSQDNPAEAVLLSRMYSAPQWLVELWADRFGPERTIHLLEASLSAPPLGLRFNMRHPAAPAFAEEQKHSEACLRSSRTGLALTRAPENMGRMLEQGVASRQSFAAQEALLALSPETWPEPVWDACSGRGGKSFLVAELGKQVLASDINLSRLRGLVEENRRLGHRVPCFRASAAGPLPLRRAPRTVLLDVPCSGLGVLSRRPDIKWKQNPEGLQKLARLQEAMLRSAWSILSDEGSLVYMTCTMNPWENEHQVERFLANHPQATLKERYQTPADSPLREFFFSVLIRRKP
jgi:16S rRNA (cytosine967-C5)-methyltransferase